MTLPALLPTLALTLAALLLRLAALAHTRVIARDGITYLELASLLTRGETGQALASHYPPGYPTLLAVGAGPWGLSETTAGAVTAVVASLTVPAVVALGTQAHGRAAGLCAGALAALLPLHVELGAELLADAPHLTALAWLLLCLARLQAGRRPWAWALGAAACGGLGYLIRPESLVALAAGALGLLWLPRPADARGRARLRALGWLALPAALALLPYLLRIRDEPVLGGEAGAGLLKLTKKQNLPQLLAAVSPSLLLARAGELARRTGLTCLPLLPGLLGLAWLGRPLRPASRRLAAQLLWIGGCLAATFVVVRADRRFTAQLALLALPHAGLGLTCLARRLPWPRPRALTALVTALALACLPAALRDRRRAKLSLRDAGVVLSRLGARRVLAHDSRPAYYAGATPVTPLAWFDASRPPPDARQLLTWASEQDADALVVELGSPGDAQVSRDVAQALHRAPQPVRRPGAVELDVFWLRP